MFIQGRQFRPLDLAFWLIAAFILGIELGHWLFYLLWVAKGV